MNRPVAGAGLQDISPAVGRQDAKMDNIAFCATPADNSFILKRKAAGAGNDSIGSMIQQGIVQHQLGISLNLIFLLTLTYAFFPSLRHTLEPFFRLQHPLPSGLYEQDRRDMWVVLAFVVFFTGLRAFFMDYLLSPLAMKLGVKKGKMRQRFAEQSYMLIYYGIFWSLGLSLLIADTPALNASTIRGRSADLLLSFWKDFPRLGVTSLMKWYYLAQTAFWVQQVLVIHLEERRSDHYQMLAHHFITIGLLVFSYGCRQTRVGNAILVLMDTVDLIFPFAKCLRYVGLQTACDIAFGVFVISWILTRHIAYCLILYTLTFDVGNTINLHGTYSTKTGERLSPDGGSKILENLLQPFIAPDAETVQWNMRIQTTFITMLGSLQVITCVWLVMIFKVVIRVLSGKGADDSRSDDEGDEEEEKVVDEEAIDEITERKFIEVTADADDLYYPQTTSSRPVSSQRLSVTRRTSKGISSGLKLGEHKEILNRIGCLSEEQLARERERRRESSSPQPGSSKRS